jgi:hypothetical protein
MKNLLAAVSTFFLLCFGTSNCYSQTKLNSILNTTAFKRGDTLNFELNLSDSFRTIKTASIHLWIENISNGKKWHYKYPLINGYLKASLIIDSTITPGSYALNFLMQKNFFRIKGEVKNAFKKENQINYVLLSKNKDIVTGSLQLDIDKFFISDCMLFQDSANLIFSRPNHKGIKLEIQLINELDSSFTVADSVTKFISIYDKQDTVNKNSKIFETYVFSEKDRLYKTTMQEVIVNAKSKKLVDDFQKENVSGMFGGIDGTVIDGLESDEIAHAGNLFNFLTGKVAGLNIKTTDEGIEELVWRKHTTEIYIDEIKADPEMALDISLSDIAMIKIFEPGVPVSFGSASGGTIAIYLKKGIYAKENKPSNHFYINGYTGLNTIWK